MVRIILLILALILSFAKDSMANDSTLQIQLSKAFSGSFKNVEVDNLNNVYFISSNNQLKKTDANFKSLAAFNDSRNFGNISAVDVSNPLKILVFYKDFSTILVLDRFLNVINSIDLRKSNFFQVSVIATSYDSKIWLFDEIENKIFKIDDYGVKMMETADFRMLFENSFIPEKMIDNNGKLYAYDKSNGLMTMDYYGGLKQNYPIKNLKNIIVANDALFGFDNNELVNFNLSLLTKKNIHINYNGLKPIKQFVVNQQFFVLDKVSLNVFDIK